MVAGPRGVKIVAPTVVRFYVHTQLSAGHKATNVVDVSVDAAVGTSRDDAVADMTSHFSTIWQENIAKNELASATYLGAHFVDLDSLSGSTGDIGVSAGHPISGTNASAPASPQVAYLIHLNSISRRGQRQGRLYWTPIAESDVGADGSIAGGAKTYQESVWNGFRTALDAYNSLSVESAAWRTVHVHKPNKTDPSTWTWSSSTIDTVACDIQCATQRRRNRK